MSATPIVALVGGGGGGKHLGSPEIRVQQCSPEQRPAKYSENTAWDAQFFPVSSTDAIMKSENLCP